jgi:type VI secretion system protein ImpJ
MPTRTPATRRGPLLSPRPAREIVVADPVRWYDGMPLAPQHFQESARRVERLVDYHLDVLAPYHYGVLALDVDAASLSAGVLSVEVEAVLPDRLVVSTTRPITMKLDAEALRKKLDQGTRGRAEVFDVYLAVPSEHPGRDAAGENPRYLLPSDGDHVTDDTTGTGDLEVHRLVPNVRVFVDVEPPPDTSWIRLAQLRLDGVVFSRADYIPPLLQVSEVTPLFDLCRRLVETIRSLANRLGERIGVLSQNTDAELIAASRVQLYHLTAALPQLEALLFTRRAHPFPLYVALAGVIGQLAPLALSPVPPRPPAYQHDDLRSVFAEMETTILRIIREGIQQTFKAHAFDLDGQVFRLDFVSDWADRDVLLAVREPAGGDLGGVKRWVQGAIVGPLRIARDLQSSRALGVERELVPRKDDLVPTSDEALFELKGLKRFITADEPLVIWNPDPAAEGLRPMEAVLYVKEPKTPA